MAVLIAGYWDTRLCKAGLGSLYVFAKRVCFFDFEEPLAFFFLDYLAVMGLFVWIRYYLSKAGKQIGKKKKDK